jgi:F420-dependent oxidoreductase-like protein
MQVMMEGRLGFQFPHERSAPADELLSYVRMADTLGYDTMFVPEAWGRETFSTLGWAAANTSRIKLGPGIANVFSRTPGLLAQSVATLDDLSGGRAVLGLGTSGPAVIENWHGLRFENGLRRTLETVDVVRMALSGSKVDYDGEIFKLRNFRLGFKPPRDRVPIYIGSLGPKNNAQTGRIADGWVPIWLPLEGIKAARAELNAQLDIAPYVMTCVSSAPQEAYDYIRPHLAYYVGGMGTFYRDVMSRFGFPDESTSIHSLWQSGKRKEAVAAVTNAMIDGVAIAGPAAKCRERIEEYRKAGVDMPVISIPHGAPREVFVRTIEALA